MHNLGGQTYLVTGGSRGVGKAIAIELAKASCQVIILARPSVDLDETNSLVQSLSPTSYAVQCDMSSLESIREAAHTILSHTARLDGLIHNAGDIHPITPLLKANSHEWNRSMMVNLIGVQALTSELQSTLRGEHRVRVTTISSGAATRPLPSWSAYCTSKAGLEMWTRCLAEEGRAHHLSAISIAPGIVDTNMQRTIREASEDSFPLHSTFVDYYTNGDLSQPQEVARKMFTLLTTHTMEESGRRYDIRDL